jgi:CDGSH-type Zn-finger protein
MENSQAVKSKVKAEVLDYGAIRITGSFILQDLQRNDESSPGEILLCTCGKSSNKPYCDGSHGM